MKKYTTPEIEVIAFQSADVLMTSGETPTIADEQLQGNNYKSVYSND